MPRHLLEWKHVWQQQSLHNHIFLHIYLAYIKCLNRSECSPLKLCYRPEAHPNRQSLIRTISYSSKRPSNIATSSCFLIRENDRHMNLLFPYCARIPSLRFEDYLRDLHARELKLRISA